MRTFAILGAVVLALVSTTACSKKDDKSKDKKQTPATAKAATTPKQPDQPKAVEPKATTPKAVTPKPDGYHTVTPGLIVKDVDAALAFYTDILGAEKVMSLPGPDGKTMHVEMKIGDSRVMVSVELPGMSKSAETLGGSAGSLLVYVKDVDAVVAKAEAAKAKVLMPVADQFWGDRWGMVADPFGHVWGIATHTKVVPPEKMAELAKASFTKEKMEIPGTPAKHWQPERMTTVVPSLHLADHDAALAFYEQGLGAKQVSKMMMSDGKALMHAEVMLGDSVIMFSGEIPEMGSKSPKTLGGSPMSLYVYSDDVDKAHAKAVAQKGVAKQPVMDQPWGDRTGSVVDPSGHEWMLATNKEKLTPEEISKRMMDAMAKMGAEGQGQPPEAKK